MARARYLRFMLILNRVAGGVRVGEHDFGRRGLIGRLGPHGHLPVEVHRHMQVLFVVAGSFGMISARNRVSSAESRQRALACPGGILIRTFGKRPSVLTAR